MNPVRYASLRAMQETLDRYVKYSAWILPGDPRLLPDMNNSIVRGIFNKKPLVKDEKLDDGSYGQTQNIKKDLDLK